MSNNPACFCHVIYRNTWVYIYLQTFVRHLSGCTIFQLLRFAVSFFVEVKIRMRYSESTMLHNKIWMPSSESIQDVSQIFGRGGVAEQKEGLADYAYHLYCIHVQRLEQGPLQGLVQGIVQGLVQGRDLCDGHNSTCKPPCWAIRQSSGNC